MNEGLKIVRIACFFALAAAVGVATGAEEDASAATPRYLKLHPSFVVNLTDGEPARYMRVEAQLMSRHQGVLETAKVHMPALRHQLIMLFSEESMDTVKTIRGKERLRSEALAAVNAVLERETGETPIEAVYFTSLVVQ